MQFEIFHCKTKENKEHKGEGALPETHYLCKKQASHWKIQPDQEAAFLNCSR
jgi:hypothetical protein